MPVFSASPTATGVRATIVPTLVPIGEGDEAGGDEDARQQQVVRQYMQGQVYGRVDGAHLLGALGECSGKDEYPYHQHDVLVTGAHGELVDALFQIQVRA